MSQQLMDLIDRFGGAQAVEAMATRVGLSPEQAQSAMVALMPAVAGGMADTVATQGPAALDGAAAPAAEIAATDPAGDAAVDHGTGLLGQILGGGGAAGAVSNAAAATGIDESKLSAMLPMLATLAAGALGKAGQTSEGGIGGLLGGFMGQGGIGGGLLKALDRDGDGNPLNDVLGMFGKR